MITYYLLKLPAYTLFLVVTGSFTAFSAIITFVYRAYIRPVPKASLGDIIGHIYGLLGGIYGLLIGFVILLVWGDYNDTQTNAAKEESVAVSLYREIRFYPDAAKILPLRKSYLQFVHTVLEKEYPGMERMQPFLQVNQKYINDVYRELELLSAVEKSCTRMLSHLDELAMYRNLRQIGALANIPLMIWIPLLAGYLILLFCSLFLGIESVRQHVLVNSLVGLFISLIIYIMLLINHPFSGSMKFEPDEYKTILQMEKVYGNHGSVSVSKSDK